MRVAYRVQAVLDGVEDGRPERRYVLGVGRQIDVQVLHLVDLFAQMIDELSGVIAVADVAQADRLEPIDEAVQGRYFDGERAGWLESALEYPIQPLEVFARHERAGRVLALARLKTALAQALGVDGDGEDGLVDELVDERHGRIGVLLDEAVQPVEVVLEFVVERLVLMLGVE